MLKHAVLFVLQNILISLCRLEGSEHLVSRHRESFIAVKVIEGSADILSSRPAVVAELTVFRQDRSCVGVEGVRFAASFMRSVATRRIS